MKVTFTWKRVDGAGEAMSRHRQAHCGCSECHAMAAGGNRNVLPLAGMIMRSGLVPVWV